MAATIALKSCKMQIRTKTGTLTSGADALASVISTPVIEVLRVDENLVYADE